LASPITIKNTRAVVYEAIEVEKPSAKKTAVFLHLSNENWAKECSDLNHWSCESSDSPSEKDNNNESSSD
jgi:hypothetical protein